MNSIENVSRRGFLKVVGITSGTFVLGMSLPINATQVKSTTKALSHELNFFVSIASDSLVTLVCHRSEMGQGIRTSVPQIIAEELEADWQKVSVVQAKANTKYGSQGTAGSASIRNHFTSIRQIGAVAREM
jgi:isoquinoline 1-oxidoreductase beta subunit